MKARKKQDEALARWLAIPGRLRRAVHGLTKARLDERLDTEHLSVRETVHHLVEANLVASNIIIAALADSGSKYDWTWVNPGGSWMKKLGYDRAPVAPAIATLSALSRHFAAILAVIPDGLQRTIQLNDAPGAPRYTKTVRQILDDEAGHADEHLATLPRRRAATRRARR